MSLKPTVSQDPKNTTHSNHAAHDRSASPHPVEKATHKHPTPYKSFIGNAVFIKGDMSAKEDILVVGRLEGTVTVKDNWLEIGLGGYIEANAFAKVVVVNGEIKGDIYASEQVIITQSGRVFGNIYSANVSIEAGALLKGNIDMEKHEIVAHHTNADVHEESHSKPASFSMLFKRVQEMAHIHSPSDLDADLPASSPAANASETRDNLNDTHNAQLVQPKSIVGETVHVKGEIVAEEDVVINGKVDGIIYFKNNSIEIGSHAQIKANIFVKAVISHGEVKGDMYASEHVIIKKSGHVYGKILSPRISIESGAIFKGSVEMEQQNIEKIFSNIMVDSPVKEHVNQLPTGEKMDALIGTFEKM